MYIFYIAYYDERGLPGNRYQMLALLAAFWITPYAFEVSYEEYVDKVLFFEHISTSLGVPVIDSEMKEIYLTIDFPPDYEIRQREKTIQDITLTTRDMVHLGQLYLNRGNWNGKQLREVYLLGKYGLGQIHFTTMKSFDK